MATKQWHTGGAEFNSDGTYRYRLWRIWDETHPRLLWILLNPSTADGQTDDRTVRRCLYFTRGEKTSQGEMKYGSLEIVNLFACCAITPQVLKRGNAPIDSENERYLTNAMACATDIVVAWGAHGGYLEQDRHVLALLNQPVARPLWCLGTVQNGRPRHPCRTANSVKLVSYP